jgi:hypothetical protein
MPKAPFVERWLLQSKTPSAALWPTMPMKGKEQQLFSLLEAPQVRTRND